MFNPSGTALTGARGASIVVVVAAIGLVAAGAIITHLWAPPRVTAAGRVVLAPCVGDCDGDGTVTVDDLIKMVGIATGAAQLSACPVSDGNGDGQVTIDDLIIAVNNALNGCTAVSPTATPTPRPTPTPTLSFGSAVTACDNNCQAALRLCRDERFFDEYSSVDDCTNQCVSSVANFASDVEDGRACMDAQVQFIQCCTARGRCGVIPACDREFVSAANACGGRFGGCPLIFF